MWTPRGLFLCPWVLFGSGQQAMAGDGGVGGEAREVLVHAAAGAGGESTVATTYHIVDDGEGGGGVAGAPAAAEELESGWLCECGNFRHRTQQTVREHIREVHGRPENHSYRCLRFDNAEGTSDDGTSFPRRKAAKRAKTGLPGGSSSKSADNADGEGGVACDSEEVIEDRRKKLASMAGQYAEGLSKPFKHLRFMNAAPKAALDSGRGINIILIYGVLFSCAVAAKTDTEDGYKSCPCPLCQKLPARGEWHCACSADCKYVANMDRHRNGQCKATSTIRDHIHKKHGVSLSETGKRKSASAKKENLSFAAACAEQLGATRYWFIRMSRLVIKRFLPFRHVEDPEVRANAHPDWKPCNRASIKAGVGEQFLACADEVRAQLQEAMDTNLLPGLRVNADLW
jgi:hypothetical protein